MVPISKSVPFLQRVLDIEPYILLLFGFFWGIVLIVGGYVLNIDSLVTSNIAPFNGAGQRQVGYGSALNWSFTYAVLFPVSLYLMVESLRSVKDPLEGLHNKSMVRDQNMRPVIQGSWTGSWPERSTGRRLLILSIGVVLPASLSLGEWFSNNLLRLLGRGPSASYPDYDWGLAGVLFHWTHGMRL